MLIDVLGYILGIYVWGYIFDRILRKFFKINISNYLNEFDQLKIVLGIALIIVSIKTCYYYTRHNSKNQTAINNAITLNSLSSNHSTKGLMEGYPTLRIYSVMYRVGDQKNCINKLKGNIVDALIKDKNFNGFICVSKNFEYIGKEDTIGINFKANDLAECQKIVANYWLNSPNNRYSWYPNPQTRERKLFNVQDNTCSVEYPSS
ncbi:MULTISPECIES: hypothetical protein [Calothrix]|uniref:Uncharacterized protein n=2 Tax=Calothrix TaxID=1186 RepID=A0ABR8AG52_9CYAN|nr:MULTISPECIES: hypothetical protein [Calothrix]MBD2197527.1 hypothetical protein [Calothrix parietina FACHB-288]MBD2226099.1 hypothetical protein [Calothrix anomala FACHB-343]